MTEDEAKTKWCPAAREVDRSANGVTSHNHNTKCIASDCMMWVVTTKAGGGLLEDHGRCGLTK